MMSIHALRFVPRPVPTLAAALFMALTIGLGNWQTQRAEEKLEVQHRMERSSDLAPVMLPAVDIDIGQLAQRRVFAMGEFLPAKTLYIDNRVYQGQPGYHVVTPLRLQGSGAHVLVNRGWVAVGRDRGRLPAVVTPEGLVRIEGMAVVPPGSVYELAPDTTPGPLRQHLVLARIASELSLELQPVVLQQTSSAPDGLVRDWPKPSAGADVNRAYALQWYAMALAALVMWLVFSSKRRKAGAV